jgi:hypothetical protein
MRDSDVAIGGLVLLGIMGAFAYFLFPNVITGILRGPSYAEVIRAHQSEIDAFNRETDTVTSYLLDSLTMKIYRRIDSVIGRRRYEDRIETLKAERDELIRDSLRSMEKERQIADRVALSL